LRTFLDTHKHFEENDKIYISLTTPGFMSHGEPHSQVSPRLIKTQRFCLSQPIDSTITLTIEPELQKRINLIHKQWIQNVLDTRLKSLELMGDR
ncbi:hypothetical protein KC717_05790, partial [Candidatus Dojkabacteria bacterium]|nr:hypothetical protein [Candidatus Dojkabacteria bacterium]